MAARWRCSSPRRASSNIQPRIDGAQDALKKSGKNFQIDVITSGAAGQ